MLIQKAQANRASSARRIWRRYGGLLVAALFVFATWRRYSNWPAIFDIKLWDETLYMAGGLSHTFRVFGGDWSIYEQGPLYCLYYYLVGLFFHDPLKVYFAGGLIIQLFALLSIVFVSWRLSRSLAVSALVLGLILCSFFLLVWPRVSYLAVVFVMLGSWLARLEPRLENRLAVTMLTSLIICFIRPEFVLIFYLSGVLLTIVVVGWRLREFRRNDAGWNLRADPSLHRLVAYLCLSGLLCVAFSFSAPT